MAFVIKKKVEKAPPFRMVVYGTPGIGKTSFAGAAPNSLLIQVEDGAELYQNITCTEKVTSFLEFMNGLYELADSDFETISVDSVDALEGLITTYVVNTANVKTLGDLPYGQGYSQAAAHMANVQNAFDHLRSKGKNVIVIAHSKEEKFSSPTEGDRTRWNLEAQNAKIKNTFAKWADIVLFANWDHVEINNERKRIRCCFSQETANYMAKSRVNLPSRMLLDGEEFFKNLNLIQEGKNVVWQI